LFIDFSINHPDKKEKLKEFAENIDLDKNGPQYQERWCTMNLGIKNWN